MDGDVKKEAYGSALIFCFTHIMDCEFAIYSVDEVQQYLASLEEPGPLVELVESWDNIKADMVKVIGQKDREILKWK